MELLCALLTGFFLWLFLYHWRRSATARAREAAGALLAEVGAPRQLVLMARWFRIPFAIMMAVPFGVYVWLQCGQTYSSRSLLDDFMIGFLLFNFLQAALPAWQFDCPTELRQQGVVRAVGMTTFRPWSRIPNCRWYERWPKKPWTRQSLLLDCRDLSSEEIEAATAAAARFVPGNDVDDQRIAEPPPAQGAAGAAGAKPSGRWRFQFNLQSLLLLTVVVSCAASCYAIHDRRLRPQREVLAKLNAFQPNVIEIGEDINWVDFKACTTKPGDDDLACLNGLRKLEYLYLDGSPVSDAGLKHLHAIKTLRSVSLSNTKVTQQGIDELQRQLPDATILCYPAPPAAPVAPAPSGK
jgi:hypothetical protein